MGLHVTVPVPRPLVTALVPVLHPALSPSSLRSSVVARAGLQRRRRLAAPPVSSNQAETSHDSLRRTPNNSNEDNREDE